MDPTRDDETRGRVAASVVRFPTLMCSISDPRKHLPFPPAAIGSVLKSVCDKVLEEHLNLGCSHDTGFVAILPQDVVVGLQFNAPIPGSSKRDACQERGYGFPPSAWRLRTRRVVERVDYRTLFLPAA